MIRFRYTIKENLLPLVRETVVNYDSDYLIGYMEDFSGYTPESISYELRHMSLYLICELLNPTPNMTVHMNPVAIVAKNDIEAMKMFYEVTGKENGTILCEIEPRCDKLKVEPLE